MKDGKIMKKREKEKWHKWWAWYPIKLKSSGIWVLFAFVARRLNIGNSWYDEGWEYEDIRILRRENK